MSRYHIPIPSGMGWVALLILGIIAGIDLISPEFSFPAVGYGIWLIISIVLIILGV